MPGNLMSTPPVLERETLMQMAAARAGLSDFGDRWFTEPMDQYLDALNREARLTSSGLAAQTEVIIKGLVSRLRMVEDIRRHPYAANVPLRQFEEQLASLTSAIERAVGERPVSYRSGRFGFSAAHVAALEQQGYLVESSVAPLFYEAHKSGPDFVEAPLRPYYLAYDSATTPGSSGLLEVPVSAMLNRRLPRRLQYMYARAPRNYTTKRVLRKLGIAYVRWLRPSYSSLDDMIGLARDLAAAGEPVLNLLFHSSEAIVGGSPYNRTEAELTAFCDRLERFFEYARTTLRATPVTFVEFRRAYT